MTPPPSISAPASPFQVFQACVDHHRGTVRIGIGTESSRAQCHQGIGPALLDGGCTFLPGHRVGAFRPSARAPWPRLPPGWRAAIASKTELRPLSTTSERSGSRSTSRTSSAIRRARRSPSWRITIGGLVSAQAIRSTSSDGVAYLASSSTLSRFRRPETRARDSRGSLLQVNAPREIRREAFQYEVPMRIESQCAPSRAPQPCQSWSVGILSWIWCRKLQLTTPLCAHRACRLVRRSPLHRRE